MSVTVPGSVLAVALVATTGLAYGLFVLWVCRVTKPYQERLVVWLTAKSCGVTTDEVRAAIDPQRDWEATPE